MRRFGILAASIMFASCGGGGGGGGSPDASAGGSVPDPGSGAIPFAWPDTEPNNTPETATPVGTSVNNGEAVWFDGSAASGTLGGSDTEDYFVFKSSPQGGTFHANPCWNGTTAPNLMDFYVYQVDNGQVGAMVASSAETAAACENAALGGDFTMSPSTVYLLELRATPNAPSTTYAA